MFKATVILIIANHWLYEVNSLPNYHDKLACINSINHHLRMLPQELIDAGVGVLNTECSFVPMPRERPLS